LQRARLEKVEVTGILSGMGWTKEITLQAIPLRTGTSAMLRCSSKRRPAGLQFYLQGGAYNLPALGTPFLSTGNTVTNIYGPFPQGYLKLVKGNFNVEIGALPTLIGAEYTFSFENYEHRTRPSVESGECRQSWHPTQLRP